jgi:hypothetical protein
MSQGKEMNVKSFCAARIDLGSINSGQINGIAMSCQSM